jgi:hypothetical protein
MAISQKDIKILWSRAAGMCSFPECKIKLTQDKNIASDSFPFGEQSHIVGDSKDSARGKSTLTPNERDSYFNLILLCPNHHTIIDNNPEDYPIEKLHLIKDQHELWVEQTLSESRDLKKTAQDIVYADLIDAAVEACKLNNWDEWASRALSTDMRWDNASQERIFKFLNKILGAVWPGTLSELECALKKLAFEMHEAIETFCQHCKIYEARDDMLIEERFYKSRGWIEDNEEYQSLFKEYEDWKDKCYKHVIEATKAANWLADVVRRDINPLFFATEGKFYVVTGPHTPFMTFRSEFLEYDEKEKNKILRQCAEGRYQGKDFRKPTNKKK